jgi:hypothetical protein
VVVVLDISELEWRECPKVAAPDGEARLVLGPDLEKTNVVSKKVLKGQSNIGFS